MNNAGCSRGGRLTFFTAIARDIVLVTWQTCDWKDEQDVRHKAFWQKHNGKRLRSDEMEQDLHWAVHPRTSVEPE